MLQWQRRRSPSTDQISSELIRGRFNALNPEIHKFIDYVSSTVELQEQLKVCYHNIISKCDETVCQFWRNFTVIHNIQYFVHHSCNVKIFRDNSLKILSRESYFVFHVCSVL